MEFKQVRKFDTLAGNTQGVCFDDDYIYISEASELMKYTHDGVFVDRHDSTPDGINHHLGDCMIKDGIIYVTSSAYPSTPYNENVKRYNASDLSYIGDDNTFTDHIGEGIDFRHGKFWTISDNFDEIYSWETGFNNPTTFAMNGPTITGSGHHFQCIVWMDDTTVATQLHGGPSPAAPQGVLIYNFDGSQFNFVRNIPVPHPEVIFGQGMAWDAENNLMYFANRNDDGPLDSVTICKLTGLDLLSFFSQHPVDKIVQEGTFSFTHSGAVALSDASTTNYPDTRIVEQTATNNYGRAGIIRGRWSVDGGVTWNDILAVTQHGPSFTHTVNGGSPQTVIFPGLRMQVAMGCSNDEIIVRALSDYINTSSFAANTVTPSFHTTYSGWSSRSQNLLIEYTLFERE